MKNLILFSFLAFLFIGCSDDDGEDVDPPITVDYLPITDSATWNYNYTRINQDQESSGEFRVDIDGPTSLDNMEYSIMTNTLPLIGAMDQIYLHKVDTNEVIIRPRFEIFDYNADMGDLLFISNTMREGLLVSEQHVEINAESTEIPANENNITGSVTPKIYITLKNYHINKPESILVNNVNYTDLTHQELKFEIRVVLDIDIQTPIPIPMEHELISNQEYGDLDLWLAKDVGIVKTEYDYSFEDLETDSTIAVGSFEVDLMEIAPELAELNDAVNLEGEALLMNYRFE